MMWRRAYYRYRYLSYIRMTDVQQRSRRFKRIRRGGGGGGGKRDGRHHRATRMIEMRQTLIDQD